MVNGADLVVSPHLDDAVLSCGGVLADRVAAGRNVTVVTVFSGAAPSPPSAAARRYHRHCGLGDDDAALVRKREDRAALEVLGCEAVHLDLPEALYREPILADVADVFDPANMIDEALARRIAELLAELPRARLLAPLGVGGHIDHRVVATAAGLLGDDVIWYEDLPYALHHPVAGLTDDLTATIVPISETGWTARMAAVSRYASQLPAIFDKPWRAELTSYATSLTGAGPAERFWTKSARAGL